jgi:hypothetical protein
MPGIRPNSASSYDCWAISESQIRGKLAFAFVTEETAYDDRARHMRSPSWRAVRSLSLFRSDRGNKPRGSVIYWIRWANKIQFARRMSSLRRLTALRILFFIIDLVFGI